MLPLVGMEWNERPAWRSRPEQESESLSRRRCQGCDAACQSIADLLNRCDGSSGVGRQ